MTVFRIREGILGGIVAGIVMAMVAMMYTLATQGDALAPVKQMGAVFFAADSGSVGSILTGLMLHMMTAAAIGTAFVWLARIALVHDWPAATLGVWPVAIVAMIYSLTEWAVASFLILPAIDRPLLATFASVGGFVAHAMYGVVLGWWLVARASPAVLHVHTGTHQHNVA